MVLSEQARSILAAIQGGESVVQIHYTPEVGDYRAGIAWPGGTMRQSANRRTVDLLRRHGYLTLLNEWAIGNGRIAVEYGITAAGVAALHRQRDTGETLERSRP
jgi:hypothetical protein